MSRPPLPAAPFPAIRSVIYERRGPSRPLVGSGPGPIYGAIPTMADRAALGLSPVASEIGLVSAKAAGRRDAVEFLRSFN
ncbi:unnamed protein product, partial [Iphiclides podalirius]